MLGVVPGSATDAETYLRAVGEDLLLAGQRSMGTLHRLPRIAEVLEAAGALDPDTSARVLAEYATAFRLRGGRFWATQYRQAPTVALEQAHVVLGPWEVKAGPSPLVVDQIRFATDGFSFKAHGVTALAGRGSPRSPARRHSPVPTSLTVTHPTGTSVAATSGPSRWTRGAWEATFESQTPLDPATPWVEIAGGRIALPSTKEVTAEAWVEDIPAGDDPVRAQLLWALAHDLTEPHGPNFEELDETIEVLVATGTRPADHPSVDEVRRVRETIAGSGGRHSSLPAPWSAWLRRRNRTDGVAGQLPVFAHLEDVEGCNLRFDALWSRENGFTLQLAVSPGTEVLGSHAGTRRGLVFWAEDDRSNAYLGQLGSDGGSWEMSEGQLGFTGPLDPAARILRILPTGHQRRGVVEIPLDGLAESR